MQKSAVSDLAYPIIVQAYATIVTISKSTLYDYMQLLLESMHADRKWMQRTWNRSVAQKCKKKVFSEKKKTKWL